jgi:hypothetical protein
MNTFKAIGTLSLLLSVLLLAGGCAGGRSQVTLSPRNGGGQFEQTFSRAFATGHGGDDQDIVLVSSASTGDPETAKLKQVLHIHVLWQPMRGTKSDFPAATNASLRWYVYGEDNSLLEYTGAGFVSISSARGGTKVVVRNASLRPVVRRGNLKDPIGPADLEGTFYATNNGPRVRNLLAGMNTISEQASADAATASHRSVERAIAPARVAP